VQIGEFSQKTGISITALRYYDKMGILTPQREGERRLYLSEDLEKARIILYLQKMDFSLKEIKKLLSLDCEMESYSAAQNIPQKLLDEGREFLFEKRELLEKKKLDLEKALGFVDHLIQKLENIQGG